MKRIGLLVLLAILQGCGTRTAREDGRTGGDQPGTADPYADPRTYEGDPFAGFVSVMTLELPAPGSGTDSTTATASSTGAWSIQIAACATEAAAVRLAEMVSEDSTTPCHIDAEGGYWKVRYGSYASPEEAQGDLEAVRGMGFTDAWVVARDTGD